MKRLLFFLSLFSFNASFAQQSVDLNPISVIAANTQQNTRETGRYITIIDGKMLHDLSVLSLDELLKYIPGVEIQNRGPMGAQADIIIRGGTYQQSMVLIDGLKINDPTTGHFNGYIPVAPAEIERIEVLRGPAAAIYGSEAVGGAINIITKSFSNKVDTTRHKGYVKAGLGSYSSKLLDGGYAFNSHKTKINIGVLSNNTNGYTTRGDNKAYVHNHLASASAMLQLRKNWSFGLRGAFDIRDFAAQNYYTTFLSDTATEKVTSAWAQLQLKKKYQNGTLLFDAAYKQSQDHYKFNSMAIPNENKGAFWIVQAVRSLQLPLNLSASYGAQFTQRSIVSNDRGDHYSNRIAAFGTIIHSYKGLTTTLATRAEYDQQYQFAFLPQINVSYNYDKLFARASVGKAIRSADFTERFNNYNKPIVQSGTIGNPDLTTEKSWNYELGGGYVLNNNLKLDAGVFLRKQFGMIDWVNTSYADMPRKENLVASGSYSLSKNISEVSTKGFEFNAIYQKKWNSNHTIFAQIGLNFFNSNSSSPTPSYYIISHANVLVQSSLIYSYKSFQLSMTNMYKERNASQHATLPIPVTKSYFLSNLSVQYSVLNNLKLFANCNNIFDEKYVDLLGSVMPGRWFTGGIHYKF